MTKVRKCLTRRFLFLGLILSFQILVQGQSTYKDVPFVQEFSVKYELDLQNLPATVMLRNAFCDRNGIVQVLSSSGLLRPRGGQFLFPGKLALDLSSRPMRDKNINAFGLYKDQFVYADDKAVLSNAWAGKLYAKHSIPQVKIISGDNNFGFLISDGINVEYIKDSIVAWKSALPDSILDIKYDQVRNQYWLLSSKQIAVFNINNKTIQVF